MSLSRMSHSLRNAANYYNSLYNVTRNTGHVTMLHVTFVKQVSNHIVNHSVYIFYSFELQYVIEDVEFRFVIIFVAVSCDLGRIWNAALEVGSSYKYQNKNIYIFFFDCSKRIFHLFYKQFSVMPDI